jgi:stearoyl-CoA desaturase (Delta-9 desaturase)
MSTPTPSKRPVNPHISESVAVNRAKRLTNVASLGLPPLLGYCLLVYTPVTWQPSLFSILLAMLFFVLGSMGLGIGFHRHFTHHAFKTTPVGKAVLGILGSWSLQGPIIGWVADHRRHHRFADQQYDPHSPWADDKGLINNRVAGWFHAHIGWKFSVAESDENRYVPDLLKDPVVMFVSRHYWPLAILGLLLPGLIGFAYGGWSECLTCLLWAGCIRAILLNQFEGVANSVTHLFGTQVEGAQDKSRDNLWLTVVLMGEGLHSYHHQNATVAVNEPSKFDAFGHFIMLCARLGLVWDLRKAKPAVLATAPHALQTGLQGTATI